jgi:hypothetical protein
MVTIPLPKPNNSALGNIALRTASAYTGAGKAVGFALEQPLHVVALPYSALRILKQLQHTTLIYQISLSSQQSHQTRPYPLFFRSTSKI